MIESAAADWDVNSRQPTRLWEGGQLAAAVADTGARINAGSAAPPDRPRPSCWLRRRHRVLVTDRVDLSPRARDFLHASIRRNRRRRRRASAVLAVLLILTLVATGSAVIQQRAAQEAQRIATVRQLIAQADVAQTTDLGIALKLSVAALRIHPDGETQSSLINLLANSGYSNTLTGHAGLVNSVVFSPNGHTVATASSDRTVRIWDVTDLRRPAEVATLTGYSGAVLTVAFSSDGRTLATGDHSRTVRVWDVADPRRPAEVATLTGHSGTVNVVAFSPDGRTLATADADQTVRLWDLTDPHQPTPADTLAERTGSPAWLFFRWQPSPSTPGRCTPWLLPRMGAPWPPPAPIGPSRCGTSAIPTRPGSSVHLSQLATLTR